jgi:hypothetical protein
MKSSRIACALVAVAGALFPAAVSFADGGPNHRVPTDQYGSSGGNINDRSNLYCCSGTLGALLTDGNNNFYILSNHHVLARSGIARVGEDISQPGLIDAGCGVVRVVADLSPSPNLTTSNVDAAIAQLRPGTMDQEGEILDIGILNPTPAAPAGAVKKSGRTTGLTTGVITSTSATVRIQYQQGCGKGKKFSVTFRNQIVITGDSGSFSAGGDSGSLIVTNDGNQPRPVGLLFAGSSLQTIANPIGEVLTRCSTALGRQLSFVGTPPETSSEPTPTATESDAVLFATAVKERHEGRMFGVDGVEGVGVGSDETGWPTIVVYVRNDNPGIRRALSHTPDLEGFPIQVVESGEFLAR